MVCSEVGTYRIYNIDFMYVERYPTITTEVDSDWFFTSRQKFVFIDCGLYYKLSDVKITVTKKFGLILM